MKKITVKRMKITAPSPAKKQRVILIPKPKRPKFKATKSPFYLSMAILFASMMMVLGNEDVQVINPSSKPVPTSPYAGYSFSKSTAKEASRVISAVPANLIWLIVSSDSDQWILIMDSATVPSDGVVILLVPPMHVAANTTTMIVLPSPMRGNSGIAVCNSTANSFTKTIGSANCIFAAKYQP